MFRAPVVLIRRLTPEHVNIWITYSEFTKKKGDLCAIISLYLHEKHKISIIYIYWKLYM